MGLSEEKSLREIIVELRNRTFYRHLWKGTSKENKKIFNPKFSDIKCEQLISKLSGAQFGCDDREDLIDLQTKTPEIIKNSKGVATIVYRDQGRLICNRPSQTYTLGNYKTLYQRSKNPPWSKPFCCSDVRFCSQPSPGYGTAFLVADDIVATAGHMTVENFPKPCTHQSVKGLAFVFNFVKKSQNKFKTTFSRDEVYFGASVIKGCKNKQEDYAFIRLDRPVEGSNCEVLDVDWKTNYKEKTELYSIGSPLGLPLKFVDNAEVKISKIPGGQFSSSNIDAYEFNSGSPVFSKSTHKVIGIITSTTGFFCNPVGRNCHIPTKYKDTQLIGTKFQKTNYLTL